MKIKTVALLHPGNMGTTIGAAAATSGVRVLWASAQRSSASRKRAEQAGLLDVGDFVSGNQPKRSRLVGLPAPRRDRRSRASSRPEGFAGIYVDANAISRATAEEVGRIVTKAGANFVDGGIIGSPVKQPGTTRLYLSGEHAGEVAALFSESMLDARAIGSKAWRCFGVKSRVRRLDEVHGHTGLGDPRLRG